MTLRYITLHYVTLCYVVFHSTPLRPVRYADQRPPLVGRPLKEGGVTAVAYALNGETNYMPIRSLKLGAVGLIQVR